MEIPAQLRAKEKSLLEQLAAVAGRWEKSFKGGEAALKEVQDETARLKASFNA